MSEKYSEQIIDSFLRELVTQQSPPDLTARITAAWERERQQSPSMLGDGSGLVPAKPISPAKPVVPAKPMHPPRPNGGVTPRRTAAASESAAITAARNSEASEKICRLPPKHRGSPVGRNVVAALLAVTACGLLAFLGSRILVKPHAIDRLNAQGETSTDHIDLAVNTNPAEASGNSATAGPGATAQVAATGTVGNGSAPRSEAAGQAQPLPLDNLPFALDNAAETATSAGEVQPYIASSQTTVEPQPSLSDTEIVGYIDRQLAQLWSNLDVVPSPLLPEKQRAEQALLMLTGQALDATTTDGSLSALVRTAVTSPEFAEHWANKLTRVWFAPSSLPLDDARVVAVEQRIASLIENGQPFNQLALDLLGDDMAPVASGAEESGEASSTTAALVSALAGNGNHRLIARIGTNLLDTNLTCVRCHEANGATPILPTQRQASAVARQEIYWSLVALLQGIDVQVGSGRSRVPIDRQPQQLAAGKPLVAYYDLLDGRLQAAEPRLPNGQAWEQIASAEMVGSPRQALAQWLSLSPAMDEATVNLVWKIIMGRPLVSQIAWQTTDDREQLATRARRELQLFLASQYRSHGHDLRQLVSWVVGSQMAARQPQELSRSQWLDASAAELGQLQLAQRNFAAGPLRPLTADSTSLENSLAAVIKWQGQSRNSIAGGESTLAQPVPQGPRTTKKRPAADKQKRSSAPTISYALHNEQPSSADVTFVSRLLASRRLSWQQCVEHVVLVNPHNALNGRIKHLADELLQQHSGDVQSALLDLLWAVKNADGI